MLHFNNSYTQDSTNVGLLYNSVYKVLPFDCKIHDWCSCVIYSMHTRTSVCIVCVCVCVYAWIRLYDENPDESMRLCHSLLDEPQLDNSVRIGDVYSVMIQHYAQSDDFNQVSFFCVFFCSDTLCGNTKSERIYEV